MSSQNETEQNTTKQASESENQVIDLKQTALQVKNEIDSYCQTKYNDGFKWRLGASRIGDDCKRAIWYAFRWCDVKQIDGRMGRLLNRGHREEPRYIEYLEALGFQVWHEDYESDPLYYVLEDNKYYFKSELTTGLLENLAVKVDDDKLKRAVGIAKLQGKKFSQYHFSAVKGHYGGSLDGICKFPAHYKINNAMLLEFKTNSTGKGFTELDKGIKLAKPAHYRQTSVYGAAYGLDHVLYLNTNKNDDDIYIEVAELDKSLAEKMHNKAEEIIFAEEAPSRISESPAFQQCKYLCEFKDICHFQKPALKNCRSCKSAKPVDNGEFFCVKENGIIPRDFVPTGCNNWQSIAIVKLSGIVIDKNIPMPK